MGIGGEKKTEYTAGKEIWAPFQLVPCSPSLAEETASKYLL